MPSSEYLLFVKHAVCVLKPRFPAKNQRTQRNQCTLLIQMATVCQKVPKYHIQSECQESFDFFFFSILNSRLGQHFLDIFLITSIFESMPNF